MINMRRSLFQWFTGALLCAVCALLTLSAAALRAEGIVGYVLSTDITAYIDGYAIPSYNVDGHLGVVAEDLRSYGFSVLWNAEDCTLRVTRMERPGLYAAGTRTGRRCARLCSLARVRHQYRDLCGRARGGEF